MATHPTYISTGGLAKKLGERKYIIGAWLHRDIIPEPELRISGRRAFSPEEVANIEKIVAKRRGRS